jgi:hypothetical protein
MLTDKYFWLAQPSSILNNYDWITGYVFAGLVALGLITWLVRKFFTSHPVGKKLLNKWANAFFWTGIIGVIWFGFRFEAVPIFSKRIWAAGVILLGLIWVGFVLWYFFRRFFAEKREYDYNTVKNKYIPGQK